MLISHERFGVSFLIQSSIVRVATLYMQGMDGGIHVLLSVGDFYIGYLDGIWTSILVDVFCVKA